MNTFRSDSERGVVQPFLRQDKEKKIFGTFYL